MASNGSSVRYDSSHSEAVHVDLDSPAKNRVPGKNDGEGRFGRRGTLVLFERASAGSWWNPKFDSVILEREVLRYYFPDTRRRFQYALVYLTLASIAWATFFGTMQLTGSWVYYVAASVALGVVSILFLFFTWTRVYERIVYHTSLVLSLLLSTLLLSTFAFSEPDISLVGSFGGAMGVLLLNYTLFPMPLYVCCPVGLLLSAGYEVLVVLRYPSMEQPSLIVCKVLLHLTLHLLGVHIFLITQVRSRSNFWKVVQCARARTQLSSEKQNLDNMIHSLMPKTVADQVMTSRKDNDNNGEDADDWRRKHRTRSKKFNRDIVFRSFNMVQMEDVSILFADIVGFTKMSSNKTAEHLVGLLNDLFGRFDDLCTRANCEKISTLGDCYYCVAGCPEPQPDHAECCVKMGLAMIQAIKEFDEDNHEDVDMRVGIHTGKVSCGIVGTRRFKFDVWSNDVTLANIMESSGKPGRVHVSEASYELLKDKYEAEPGEDVEDLRSFKRLIEHYDPSQTRFTIRHEHDERVIKTYFITGIKPGTELLNGPATRNSFLVPSDNAHAGGSQNSVAGTGAGESDGQQKNEHQVKIVSGKLSGSAEGVDTDRLDDKDEHVDSSTVPFNQSWSVDKAHHRDQADKELIQALSNNSELREIYSRLPINALTLFFNRRMLERAYRCHYFDAQENSMVASPRWQSFIEMLLSLLLFLLVALCAFLVFNRSAAFIGVFAVCLVLEVVFLVAFGMDVSSGFLRKLWTCYRDDEDEGGQPELAGCWTVHNIVGIIIATLPVLTVYANLDCSLVTSVGHEDMFLCFCLLVSLLSFCNFSMSCSVVKSLVAMLVGLALLVLLNVQLCDVPDVFPGPPAPTPTFLVPSLNTTVPPLAGLVSTSAASSSNNASSAPTPPSASSLPYLFSGQNKLRFEIVLNVLLILLLILFLNREFEISYRLSFHGSAQADRDIRCMQENKAQADWLLHNIIPSHVSHVVKQTHKYSKNHVDVGVIFATIVNFNDFYDEGYEGGREYLRVLNELVSDYEDLLDRPSFKDVEKIKTISSCFMAASGLNEVSRRKNSHPNAHLFALMDFCVELQNVVVHFNESILNFNFELNIGYNYGEVTAGVIGTTKLLYDIWGDTVNIASRMYSTGERDRIQVPESTLAKLEEMFEFEYRGEIYVKGKGDMKTYLYKEKRPGAHWE